jgi:hypothetical protein
MTRGTGIGAGVLGVVAVGTTVRLLLAGTHAPGFDLSNMITAQQVLAARGLSFYAHLPNDQGAPTYPYSPGYLAWPFLLDTLGVEGRISWVLLRLPVIASDAVLALLLARFAPRGGPSSVLAAALVALHPVAIVTAGIEGQIDLLAFLPVLVAALLWRRSGSQHAAAAGLLVGLGTIVKTPACLGLLGLATSSHSWRRARALVLGAAASPFLLVLPFAIAEPAATVKNLYYRGLPGAGGLSLLVQPGLVNYSGEPLSGLSLFLQDVAPLLLAASLTVCVIVARRTALDGVATCALVLLAIQIVGVNWFPQYALWPLPFAILAGAHRWMAASFLPLSAFVLPYVDTAASISGPVQVMGAAVWMGICGGAIAAVFATARASRSANSP